MNDPACLFDGATLALTSAVDGVLTHHVIGDEIQTAFLDLGVESEASLTAILFASQEIEESSDSFNLAVTIVFPN